jgi:hypothetical protein
MELLDILTIGAFVALSTDIVLQINHLRSHKSSDDLSLIGLGVRYAAIWVLLYNFYTIGDWPLLVGQALLATVFTFYLGVVLVYYRKR